MKVTNRKILNSWALSQILLREMKKYLGSSFQYKKPPYEYVHDLDPIDIINGCADLKEWVNSFGTLQELLDIELKGHSSYLEKRNSILIYK